MVGWKTGHNILQFLPWTMSHFKASILSWQNAVTSGIMEQPQKALQRVPLSLGRLPPTLKTSSVPTWQPPTSRESKPQDATGIGPEPPGLREDLGGSLSRPVYFLLLLLLWQPSLVRQPVRANNLPVAYYKTAGSLHDLICCYRPYTCLNY